MANRSAVGTESIRQVTRKSWILSATTQQVGYEATKRTRHSLRATAKVRAPHLVNPQYWR